MSAIPASDLAQSEAPSWVPPTPQYTAPETAADVKAIIDGVGSDCQNRRLGDRFSHWLELERSSGKSDKEIAYALWNAAYIIDKIRQDSKANGCLVQLDQWLASEANTKLDVELAADLIQTSKRMQTALEFAQAHRQEPAFQAFLKEARSQGKPDVVLSRELSPKGVPPWRPSAPKAAAPTTDAEVRATLKDAEDASRYRGQEDKFGNWVGFQKNQIRNSDRKIAHALWEADHIIRDVRESSRKNGCLDQLDQWLVDEAGTAIDVELAAALTSAKETLKDAKTFARRNGLGNAFRTFLRNARREGKPDVVIVSELSQRGTPPWMPAWVPPVPQDTAPATDADARAVIRTTRAACERRWLGSQFEDWVRVRKTEGKSDRQIAHALWEAAHIIRQIRKESEATGCLAQLDQWLVSEANTRIDVELATDLLQAKAGLRYAHDAAREKGHEDVFLAFIDNARSEGKPDVIIVNEWTATQDPYATNRRQAENLKAAHQEAFEQHLKEMRETGPRDAHALPSGWEPPVPLPEAPVTEAEIRAMIEKVEKASGSRWLDDEFKEWFGIQKLDGKTDRQIAFELWNAETIIDRIRMESGKNGCLEQLDAWLAFNAEMQLDIELASSLEAASAGLQEARADARRNGRENAFQAFIDNARSEGKPDVLILPMWIDHSKAIRENAPANPHVPAAGSSREREPHQQEIAATARPALPPGQPDPVSRNSGLGEKVKRDTLDLSKVTRKNRS